MSLGVDVCQCAGVSLGVGLYWRVHECECVGWWSVENV